MEYNDDKNNEKKFMNKAKSCNSGPSAGLRLKNEAIKRKSYCVNEAVRSLDLALGRLKKSKLVNGEYSATSQSQGMTATRHEAMMFMDPHSNFAFNQALDNSSLMTMNLSHYELLRNISQSNCNSDGAISGTTGESYASPSDLTMKDEHLEKYFRSMEMWRRSFKMNDPSNRHLEIPEK